MSNAFPRRLLLAAPLALAAGPAAAHAILLDSTPAAGATVPAGKLDIRLRFNSRIDADRSRLILIAPDKSQTTLPLTGDGAVLTSTATPSPGANILRWQVLAIDGHITRGDVAITVGKP